MSLPAPIIRTWYDLDWVLLNNRWWSIQNYSPTKLADDTDIPIVTDAETWAGLTTPARCVHNNSTDAEFIAKYGYLYNWYGYAAGLEMPCAGCVVPSDAEWGALRDYLVTNGYNWDHDPPENPSTTENRIGKAMASSGGEWTINATAGNVGNDQASNNSSGFNALPGGYRTDEGSFVGAATRAWFWSSTEVDVGNASIVFFRQDRDSVGIGPGSKKSGASIRILRTAYIVTYNSQGGSAVAPEITAEGELITAPTAPTKAGHVFSGWYKEDTFTTEWDFETDTVTEDITLYAKWEEEAKPTQRKFKFGFKLGFGIS